MTVTTSADTRIEKALDAARRAYENANPQSRAAHQRARRDMPGGNTRSTLFYEPFPLVIESAVDATLTTVDGHQLLDLLGDFTASLYGHSNPVIMRALREVLDKGINFGAHNQLESQLAGLLTERFPSVDLVRFTNSGTEANLMAVALAKAITGRSRILVFDGAYHGGVLTFIDGSSPVNVPHDFLVATYNDAEGARSLLQEQGDAIAAVLVEPMLGAGGCLPATPEFLVTLREETHRAGALLVFDEVMTSRLAPHGLQGELDLLPDLTTLGKYLGGGMSFGAFGGRRELMERFDPSKPRHLPHAGTFNNNVLSMVAGVTGLREVFSSDRCTELNARGEQLRHAINQLLQECEVNLSATGRGSLLTFHPTTRPIRDRSDMRGLDERIRELLFFDLIARGFWMARRGMVALSLPVNDVDCRRLVDALRDIIDSRRSELEVRP